MSLNRILPTELIVLGDLILVLFLGLIIYRTLGG